MNDKKQLLLFIKNMLVFAPVCFVAYLLLLCVWGDLLLDALKFNLNYRIGSYGHMYSRLEEARETENVDILFLGSSHTYRGFDTRIFGQEGFKTFNLGSSAQTPLQTNVLLKRYLESLNPKLVIYEVYPATFALDGVESSLDIIANDRNDANSIKMAIQTPSLKVFNTMVYGLYKDLAGANSGFAEPAQKDGDTYVAGGFVEKKMQRYKHTQHPAQQWEWGGKQLEVFGENVRMIENAGIPIVFVQTPINNAYYKAHTNNADFDAIMSVYGEYRNFNELMHLDDSLHFFDLDHMNQAGVELFDRKLINTFDLKNIVSSGNL